MIDHYDNELFPLYERLTKLDNSNSENKLDNNRFFLKNDAHGAGGAFYSNKWTADSYKDGTMWLQNQWGHQHEIGHGFQNDLMRQQGMGEVSNNILGAYYDFQKFGIDTDNKGWIFDYGKRDTVESKLSNQLKAGKSFSKLELREKLILIYFLLSKLDSNGEGISKINESSRNLSLFNIFNDKNSFLSNKLLGLANSKEYDYRKVLDDYSFDTNKKTFLYNGYFSSKKHVVDSIASLIAPENREKVIQKLMELNPEIKSQSIYNLVTPEELLPLGLKGQGSVAFEGILPDELLNTKLNVFDGDKLIASKTITNKEGIVFDDLPLGTYRLEFEGMKPGMYIDNDYLTIRQRGADKYNIDSDTSHIEKSNVSNLTTSNEILFEGLADDPFMRINTGLYKHFSAIRIATDFFRKTPHSYFAGEKYASINIKNGDENLIDKTIFGDSEDIFKQVNWVNNNSLKVNLNIYHAEPNRLKITNVMDEELSDKSSKETSFILDSYGLRNINNKDKIKNLKSLILFFGDKYMADPNINSRRNELIEDLYTAINTLPENEAKQYFDKYKKLFDLYN
ncbi:putative mucin/carbohydrate-binding domain-containing protein [Companilactobacillus sp. DQM5]|uniref:putative mucin/carbohydrate-binding domain-containing protein n=1 Tax=Companilactobacillus sp. DQM5 TaxID=3463359 RepID=UPI004059AD2E